MLKHRARYLRIPPPPRKKKPKKKPHRVTSKCHSQPFFRNRCKQESFYNDNPRGPLRKPRAKKTRPFSTGVEGEGHFSVPLEVLNLTCKLQERQCGGEEREKKTAGLDKRLRLVARREKKQLERSERRKCALRSGAADLRKLTSITRSGGVPHSA